ncbi:MAG TPA: hypothetical protein VHE37_02740 [Nevskiaceae bacterium]|nr:hypothetical protein [Nevskiaceae bacterium]
MELQELIDNFELLGDWGERAALAECLEWHAAPSRARPWTAGLWSYGAGTCATDGTPHVKLA